MTAVEMVPVFLARTVEGLAAFEDTLLKRDGFFQRQEHFEAKIDAIRQELDRNARAKVVFSNPDAVQALISSLTVSIRAKPPPKRTCVTHADRWSRRHRASRTRARVPYGGNSSSSHPRFC